MKKLYNTTEAAEYLKIKTKSLYRIVAAGKLEAKKPGKHLLFTEDALEKYAHQNNRIHNV